MPLLRGVSFLFINAKTILMRWFILIFIYIIIDIYAFQAIRTISKSQTLYILYILISLLVLGNLIYQFTQMNQQKGFSISGMYAIGFFLVLFVPKLVLTVFMFGEDIMRLLIAGFNRLFQRNDSAVFPSRRNFIGITALGIAAVPFFSLLYGMYKGKYRYKVLKYQLEFEDLPEAFDGYTITQISDVHSGSFDNEKKVSYGVDLINEQKSNLILFTGDLVNNVAGEMKNWQSLFSTLKAEDGVYSVLGNHDYGDYVEWETAGQKAQNLEELKDLQKEMGWDLLLNESREISKDKQSIHIVGVENWGLGGFKKEGDIDKATGSLQASDFKIVMSHDPSYWEENLRHHDKNFQLTLSGHTHGMQFGIEIPGLIKWSPVKYRYPQWAGIYKNSNRHINVNRGFGFLAYPGRVGIWPEISVIELKKKIV